MLNCKHGIYRIYWKSGGSSVASIGSDYQGNRWMAPSNWTCPEFGNPTCLLKDKIKEIESIQEIASQHEDDYGDDEEGPNEQG